MAIRKRKKPAGGAENPTSQPDPRFDPASDAENAAAHGMEPEIEEKPGSDDSDVQSIVKRMLEQAVQHYTDELEPEQTEATDYYKARPFGDEREGRSKVVQPVLRNVTLSQMPSLLRVLFGPERVVEFEPRGPEDVDMAAQQTDGVRYAVLEDNPGFIWVHDSLQDGLVRKLGVVKWWWDEKVCTKATRVSGYSAEDVALLQMEPGVVIEIHGQEVAADGAVTFDLTVTRTYPEKRVRVEAVPPEEFVYTPGARSLETAQCVAHVREVPADELLGMGIDEDIVERNRGKQRALSSDDLPSARQFDEGGYHWKDSEDDRDASQRPVLYAEAYCLIDGDGDGIAERRLFQCVGPDFEVANGDYGELVDEVPFACWSPYREAHTIVGDGNHDLLKTDQRVQSQLWRLMLDSFSLAVNNKQEVVQGQVNMADLLNDEVGGFVRVRAPGMVREIGHTFVGEAALPVLQFSKSEIEDKTGTSRAAMGLDADALQSSTKAAVAATLSGSQQRLEMIVRMYAETLLKPLFRGVCGLMVKHQDKARMVRLRNKWVQMDPRYWDAGMDLRVNVALGQGTSEDKINALAGAFSSQLQLKQMGAPFIGWHHIRQTAAKAAELAGFKDADEFYGPWSEQDEQAAQQAAAQQQPPPDPTMILAQIEQMKVQLSAQEAQAKMQLEEWKAIREDDRARDKLAIDSKLKEHEIELRYQVEIEDARLKADVAQARAEMDADVKREQAKASAQPVSMEIKPRRAS